MYTSLRSNLVGLGATLPVLLLSLHPSAVFAYEIAFHPFWLALRGIEQFPIHYQVYPRFTCNAVPLDDLEPDSATVQNVLVRTAADASGPPKVIVFYRAPADLVRGVSSPCAFRNGVAAAYFSNVKPSQQVFYVEGDGRITHFKEIDEGMPEWGRLVRQFNMAEGQVVYKDNLDGEWFAYGDTVDVRDFDVDLAYASDLDYTFRSGDDDDSRTVSTDAGLDRSGEEWDLEFTGPYPVSFGPGLEPDIQVPYGTRWAPGQMVPDWEVYRPDYRDWRNWMISEGNYRGLSSDFTDRYPYDQLRRMGYLIDESREMAMRQRKAEVQELAREAEGGYEQMRAAERAIRGGPALDLNSEYMQNLFRISTPDGGSPSLDPLTTLMDIRIDELQAGEVVASPSNIADSSVMELEEELPQDGNHMQSLFEDVLGQDSRPDQPDSNS